MDNKSDKKLNEFTEKLIQDFSLETTSLDFTTRVMSKVEALSDSEITEYKPLISRRVWMVLAMIIIGAFAYLIFGDVKMEGPWLSAIQSDIRSNLEIISLPDFKVSNVFLYAIVGFTFFVSIQILFLKNHFDKRFA